MILSILKQLETKKYATPNSENTSEHAFIKLETFAFLEPMKKNKPGNTKLTVASANADIKPNTSVKSSIVMARKL